MEIVEILLLIILIIATFYNKRPKKISTEEINKVDEKELTKNEEIDEETKEKQKKIRKAFNNLMEYDENVALKKEEE